ncbi:g-protein coupled receptor 143 [Nephila pilipes]|uniref:G-protein coupled receptor 143 n=1 Tax=Nephila pilipes TaxID=299642 RepID=A0A8X6P1S3_NEPPI|nr:g-protein coupled receptor 143 [Nephila pilipes]
MASATIETFCCMASKIEPSILTHLQFQSMPYNIVCVISSVLGMIGATYQVLPSPPSNLSVRHRSIGHTQRAIINWLAMADFFAASGILLRSVFWLWKGDIIHQDGWNLIVCAIFAIWIRFFYTATFMWTLFYAVDVYLVCKQRKGNQKCYHAVTWLVSLVMTTVGLGTLYLPEFQCHSGPARVLPNYLLSYIPIVLVMFINPVLYYLSSRNLRILITGGLGQLTYLEHNLLATLKEKFFCIVLVFYVCWLPNVLNGIMLWGFWDGLPRKFIIGLWYVMAVVNPLQAVLNSLVYKGWDDCRISWREFKSVICCCRDQPHPGLILDISSSDHQFTPERPTFSTNHFD